MFDHPIILLIVVAAALLRWFAKKSQEENQDPERPSVPGQAIPRSGETQTEEERIRRFLEALGQPAGSTPPPKVAPKRQVVEPRRRSIASTLPPLVTVPPPLPAAASSPVASPPPPPLPTIERPVFTPARVQEVGFEVRDVGAQAFGDLTPERSTAAAGPQDLWRQLASREELRNAIVLREIFGPPRSLQPLETVL